MKIVHVEDFFHPDAGYQVNLLSRLQSAAGHHVTVVTAELAKMPRWLTDFFGKDQISLKDARFERETGVSIVRVPLIGFYSGRVIFQPKALFSAVSSQQPDVVFVHGETTLTGMLFTVVSRHLGYPIILDSHMLEMASMNRLKSLFRAFYRLFITPIILKDRIPLIRVVDSDFVFKCLGIPLERTELLSFGTDTSFFRPDTAARQLFRREHDIADDTYLVLYAGKLDAEKGGKFLAEAIREKFKTARRMEFVIVGNTVGEYGNSVEQILGASQNRVIRLPTQRYPDTARLYQAADLAVFPRQCSLSFFEAQSCGLPVLFEKNEINNQRASGQNAILFEPGSMPDFRAKIGMLAAVDVEEYARLRANARNFVLGSYDYVPIAAQFTTILEKAVVNWRQRQMAVA